jgi:hypothetical protein
LAHLRAAVPDDVCRPTVCSLWLRKAPASNSPRYEYLWEDGVKYKRPTKLAAPDYVDALMNWAQGLLDDEAVFPNKIGPLPVLDVGSLLTPSY